MERLFRLTAIVEADDLDESEIGRLSPADQERLTNYLSAARELWGAEFTPGRRRFYVFSLDGQIQLTHSPRLAPNPRSRCILRLDHLRDPGRLSLVPSSKMAAP